MAWAGNCTSTECAERAWMLLGHTYACPRKVATIMQPPAATRIGGLHKRVPHPKHPLGRTPPSTCWRDKAARPGAGVAEDGPRASHPSNDSRAFSHACHTRHGRGTLLPKSADASKTHSPNIRRNDAEGEVFSQRREVRKCWCPPVTRHRPWRARPPTRRGAHPGRRQPRRRPRLARGRRRPPSTRRAPPSPWERRFRPECP